MKITPFVLLVSLVWLSGCIILPKPVPEARLTALPTPPHNRPVKIIFPGEAPPTAPYVKIKVLSVKRSAGIPTTNLVQELADRAQREGADAILILGKNVYSEIQSSTTTTMDSTGFQTSTSNSTWEWQDVSALAIKYLSNLDYLPDYVREKRLLHWNAGLWQPLATGRVNYDGPTSWQPATGTLLDLWTACDLDIILPEKDRPGLKYSDGVDGRRVSNWVSGPRPDRKYRIRLSTTGRLEVAESRFLRGLHAGQTEKILYRYDDEGRLSSRQIESLDWGTIVEKYHFGDTGKLSAVEWTRDGQNFLKMDLVYYRVEDAAEFAN